MSRIFRKKLLLGVAILWYLSQNLTNIYAQNKYIFQCLDQNDSIRISVSCSFDHRNKDTNYLLLSSFCNIKYISNTDYTRRGDTLQFNQWVKELRMDYLLPKTKFKDSVICLRRENNWYPHRNGELLTATLQIKMKESSNYVVCGERISDDSYYVDTAYEIHLIILPKDKYSQKIIESSIRPFIFYQSISDTSSRDNSYYSEFVNSYHFYSSFFGDSISREPLNIVEITDTQFVMCQSLNNVIVFGHYFYQVYTFMPSFSWIPHEVAHLWWGNRLFFDYRDYAMSESLNEYIKLQFLKSRKTGYKEQVKYYKTMMEYANIQLPIADIRNLETMDESIAIYHTAPYVLEQMNSKAVCTSLQRLYSEHRKSIVTRQLFEQGCANIPLFDIPRKKDARHFRKR